LRVRIKRLPPPGELDEFDLRRFRVGDVYDVGSQLGTILVVAGYAEPAPAFPSAEAADFGPPKRFRDKKN
jgi:hypothetical protein